MLNFKTLKVGNYVQSANMILQVISIDGNEIYGAYFVAGQKHGEIQITDSSEIEGIKLSKSLLFAFGFKELKNISGQHNSFTDKRGLIIIQNSNGGYKFSDDVIGTYHSESDLEFQYVHQLQNKYFKKTHEFLSLPSTPDQYEQYL